MTASARLVTVMIAALIAYHPGQAVGQTTSPATTATREALTIQWNVPDQRFIDRRTAIEFSLSRALEADEGEIAVLIGSTDVTDLLEGSGTTFVYRPRIAPLPPGERDVAVYRRSAEAWTELQRFSLKVLTRRGLVRALVSPTAALGSNGQLAEGHSSGMPEPERPTFQDLTLTSGLRSSHQGTSWTVETQGNVAGASRRDQALRFSQRGADAPRVDLADYVVTVTGPRTRLALGHVTLGNHRHLASGFGSRGLTVASTVGPATLSLGAVNGTSVVGWDNFVGLDRSSHRVTAAELAAELVPRRPGALKATVSMLDGSLLPEQSFTQGAVVDAERSKGFGVQVAGKTAGERVTIAAGYAQSRFLNPSRDPELLGDSSIVPVAAETRRARYADVALALIREANLANVGAINLATGYRHERIDPLYRSAATSVQADRQQHVYDVTGSAGVVAVQVAHTRSRDNLDDLPSVLRTATRQSTLIAAVALPTTQRLGRAAQYFPTLTLNLGWGRQVASPAPTNGDFRAQDLPDQTNEQRELGAQWQLPAFQLSYRYNATDQDNRQPERESADFDTRVHAVSATRPFGVASNVGLELSTERQRAAESGLTTRVNRVAATGNWKPFAITALSASLGTTLSRDASRADGSRNLEGRLELAQSFLRIRRGDPRGQLFVRYGITDARARLGGLEDPASAFTTQRQWTLSSGVTFKAF